MKICKVCNEINDDENIVCRNPECLSSGDTFKDYNNEKYNVSKRMKSKSLNRSIGKSLIIIIYALILVTLIIINKISLISTFKFVLIGLIGVLCFKFTSTIFIITHLFSLKNVENDQMSDMYETYIKLIGVILALYPLVMLTIKLL